MQTFPALPDRRLCESGFTLKELLVVITLTGLLGIVLLPAFAGTVERSKRAACLNNLRQICVAMTIYAGNNSDSVVRAQSGTIQVALEPPTAAAAPSVGLVEGSDASLMWSCPNRPQLPVYEPSFNQWLIGYQYFGGVATWRNALGNYESRSPLKLSLAAPHWTLAADPIIKMDGTWGGGRGGFEGIPQHHGADSIVPQSGNHVFVDGSASWVKFENLMFLHSWSPATRKAYFFQDSKDFPPTLRVMASMLSAQP